MQYQDYNKKVNMITTLVLMAASGLIMYGIFSEYKNRKNLLDFAE